MRQTWTFHSAGQLLFGPGAVQQLGCLAGELRVDRVFFITDVPLAKAGVVDQALQPLQQAGCAVQVFEGGLPEPSLSLAQECIEQARRFGPSAVLGLGGGSNMDLAKITAASLAHSRAPRDFVGEAKVPGPVLPTLCVPTTAGTGSEVSAAAVLTDSENHIKVGVLSNYLRPRLAVVDPLLTLSCPPKVTADSGIDALTHAIEAYTAVDNAQFPLPAGEKSVYQGRHPLGLCLAEKAIELIGQHLVAAVREPGNRAAREGMSLAATLAGLAFSNIGVALVHAMEYPVGGAVHCSHGEGNGLLLPYVMRYNLPLRQREFATIARLLGCNLGGLDEDAAARAAIAAVESLRQQIGIPQRLRELGVQQDQLPVLAEKAFAVKRILRVNPRAVTCQDIEAIFRAAW
jgi:alcohol dehydrogenase class IV